MKLSLALLPALLAGLLSAAPEAPPLDPTLWSPRVPRVPGAREYFVATNGSPAHPGTQAQPWDLASVLKGAHPVEPGSVIWLADGRYVYPVRQGGGNGFPVSLSGAPGKPLHLRPRPGAHAIIDGGFELRADHLWLWELDFQIGDNWRPAKPVPQGEKTPFPVPTGVLNLASGTDLRVINCLSHNNAMGFGFWKTAVSGEVHGCVIYDNGFPGADRPHGPAIYTQNESGTPRLITDTIIGGNFSLPLQLYGSKIDRMVNDYTVEGNILIAPRKEATGRTYALLGGPNSRNIVFRHNLIFGYTVNIGDKTGQICESNIIIRGSCPGPAERNTLIPAPDENTRPIAMLRPNLYDPRRANLAVAAWPPAATVTADLGAFLRTGEAYCVLAPFDFHGKPLAEGVFDGKPVVLPVPTIPWNLMTGDPREVGVFVIMKKTGAGL
jgi:hypothetical protein